MSEDLTGSVFEKPDFDIAESKKDAEWYKSNIRYYSNYYNTSSTSSYDTSNPIEGWGPVRKGLHYYKYLYGTQENLDFNHLLTDPSGNTLQATWQKGRKIKQLIDHLKGNINTQLENKYITTISLSDDVMNSKKRKLDNLMLAFDTSAQAVLGKLAQMGIKFTPEVNKSFESAEDAQRYMERDFRETAEIVASDIARHIELSNDANSAYMDCFTDYTAANYCGMYHYVDGGEIKMKRIPFWDAICDTRTHDKFVRDGQFGGYIERLTPEEVFSKYGEYLTNEQLEHVKEMTSKAYEDRSFLSSANQSSSLTWWDFYGEDLRITCVTMYWIGRRDTRHDKTTDKFGNMHVHKMDNKRGRKKNKQGAYIIDDVHKGTMIGNMYLADWGYADNVVRNPKRKYRPELPIKFYTQNVFLGEGVSPIGMVYQNQDRMDLYRFKILEMVGRDSGKSYIVNGHKLGDSIGSKELLTDLKTMGVHVYSGLSGEVDDPSNSQAIIETVDLTLDPNVQQYLALYAEEERVMEEILNIPKVALGQQSTYIGLGTQKGSIAQSNLGLAVLYRDFVKFNEINLQYAVNLAKIVLTAPGAPDAPFVVGDRGAKLLDLTKDFKFEDFLIYIKIKDIIDEDGKQRLLAYAQAWSQNPAFGIGPLEILRLERAKSYTEAENDLEWALKKRKREAEQAAQKQFEQEQAMKAQEADRLDKREGFKQSAETDRVEKGVEGKVFSELVKADSKTEAAEMSAAKQGSQGENPTKGQPIKK